MLQKKLWLKLGQLFSRRAIKPIVLSPVPSRKLCNEPITKYYTVITWDFDAKLPIKKQDIESYNNNKQSTGKDNIQELKEMCSISEYNTPEHIRDVRSHYRERFDIADEIALRFEEDIQSNNLYVFF